MARQEVFGTVLVLKVRAHHTERNWSHPESRPVGVLGDTPLLEPLSVSTPPDFLRDPLKAEATEPNHFVEVCLDQNFGTAFS